MPTDRRDPAATLGSIQVCGAREHNLQAIDVSIPRDRLTVVTGVSGSGKSCLAFDTVFRASQALYLASLSPVARRFLERQHRMLFAGPPAGLRTCEASITGKFLRDPEEPD